MRDTPAQLPFGRPFILGVIAVAVLFVAVAAYWRAPHALFGANHDDALYFTTAKAVAEGEGLVMPSVPGSPPQTKYPALYPLLLSLVWLVSPEFPANLDLAWAMSVAFGVLGVGVFAFLARQLGAGPREALILTALAVLNPSFVYWSNLLVSDIVFLVLAVGATVLAHDALQRQPSDSKWMLRWGGVVALLWLACMTRTLGVAFVAGIVVASVWTLRTRRSWMLAAGALTGALPVALKMAGLIGRASMPAEASTWEGFRQNLLYYTSYSEFWRLSVPNVEVLQKQTLFTFVELLKEPANGLLMMGAEGMMAPIWLQPLAVTVSIGVVAGLISRARRVGLHPLHLTAIFYLPIVLLWNYPLLTRFGLPFSLLLLAGASEQLQKIGDQLLQTWRKGPAADRVIGTAFACCLLTLVLSASYRSFWSRPNALSRISAARTDLAQPKREAYAWLAENTEPDAVVISYEDATLYLYTGRTGMRPASLTTEAFFMQDMAVFEKGLDKMADTAFALQADYWLKSSDDYDLGNDPDTTREHADELLEGLPVVFTSLDGRVQVVRLEGEKWARLRARRLAGEPTFAESLKPASD